MTETEAPRPEQLGIEIAERLENKKETTAEITETEAVSLVESSAEEFGEVFGQTQEIQNDPTSTDQEKQQAQGLTERAADLFRSFYKKSKEAAKALPLLLALYQPADRVIAQETKPTQSEQSATDALKREDLPFWGEAIDWYVEGDFVKIYNDFNRLSKTRENGKMSVEEVAFRENIAQNMNANSYDGQAQLREIQAGERRYSKENIQQLPEVLKIRTDFLRTYLGLERFGDYIVDSPDKPSQAKNTASRYKGFRASDILASINQRAKRLENRNWLQKLATTAPEVSSFDQLEKFVGEHQTFPSNDFTTQLGRYKVDSGYDQDRKEKYISYYDVWDIDPPILKKMGVDIDQYNFPFEVYGRVYESDFKK
jgi:transcriptional regulator with XRE-family HTH domain